MQHPLWMWVGFLGIVLALLIIDLGIFHKKEHEISVKESMWMSGFYIFMAFLFGLLVWHQLGAQSAADYYTGLLIEKSLALDNIFVFSVIFSMLSIPLRFQHYVLFWGILGVIVLRAIMILLGAKLIHEFEWVLYIFAIFMIFTGVQMFLSKSEKIEMKHNVLLKWMQKHFRITKELHGQKFLIKQKKKVFMTPLFVALVLIEFMDFIFALDSVPAIFTITQDSYIVYTSNIFAILGLRALYFALAAIIGRFYYFKFSLALVLIFIGSKVFIADLLGIEKFPSSISLVVTLGLLASGYLYSMHRSRKNPPHID